MFVQRHAGNHARVLRTAALHDAVAVGRIRRAQDRKRQPAMPEHRSGDLPSVERPGQHAIPELDRQLIDVLGGEVVADVVVAGTVLAAQLARQRRKNGSGGEGQESTVRDRVHAAAPRVVGLDLNSVAQPFFGGQLEAVVVAVGAGVQLRHRPEARIFAAARMGTARSSPRRRSDNRSPASRRAG